MERALPFPRRAGARRPATRRGAPPQTSTLLGRLRDRLGANPIALRAAFAVAIALPLLGGGWTWLRGSSFASVRHVHITGVHGTDSIEIRTALSVAARRMSTMKFDQGALQRAVASYPIVASIHAVTSFPHTVRIAIVERPPVAALQSAGQRTAVAADGTVLGPAWLSSSLPAIDGSVEPVPGARLSEAKAVADVAVLGAAPKPLLRFVASVYSGPEGLTVKMRNGLLVYFGDSSRPHAKWMSLARVLSSPSSAGARYIDVRLPERPAAGMSGASAGAAVLGQASASDPTAAALAASLSKAVGGEEATTGESAEADESEAHGGGEASTEASSGASEEAPTESESAP